MTCFRQCVLFLRLLPGLKALKSKSVAELHVLSSDPLLLKGSAVAIRGLDLPEIIVGPVGQRTSTCTLYNTG